MKKLIPLLAFLALLSCHSPHINGPFVATPAFDGYKKISSKKIRGSSCKFLIITPNCACRGGQSSNSAKMAAFVDALSQLPPDAAGLADVTIKDTYYIFLLINLKCAVVEGYPARRKH